MNNDFNKRDYVSLKEHLESKISSLEDELPSIIND